MDEELTEGYNEPCKQCGAVSWALSEGCQFFCRKCHNVIERTQDAVDTTTFIVNNKISSISSGSRKKTRKEGGRQWMVCEGFQFILKLQAEALVGLGVSPEFKTDVLWDIWKKYLQITRQAYPRPPDTSCTNTVDLSSESEPESVFLSEASDQTELLASGYSSDGRSSVCSGSLDAAYYFSANERKSRHLMNMPRTLALCHLALLWLRETITLADLLRLVSRTLVPYINVFEEFPEEMHFYGRDAMIFRVKTIPSYRKVHREAQLMAEILQLPAFPPVTSDCFLHPALLSLRYLMDANLPDELHSWVCRVIEKTAMGKDFFLTYNPSRPKSTLLCYDLQAAALIIVTMKLLFRLNDRVEWKLSRKAEKKDNSQGKKTILEQDSEMFSLETWHMIVYPALERARKREELFEAKRPWKSKKLVISTLKHKSVVLKRRREVDQLQNSFHTLTGSVPEPQPSSLSSFQFLWGQEEDADGPSLHQKCLDYVVEKRGKEKWFANQKYWHTDLTRCHNRACRNHYSELEHSLPRMYVWLLGLFSFLLGVSEAQVHKEVVEVERRMLLRRAVPKDHRKLRKRKRRRTSSLL